MQNRTLNEYISQLKSFINNNDYLPCVELLLQAIKSYPNEEKLKLNLGNIYKLLDRKNKAIDVYTSLLETSYSSIAYNNLSLIMLEIGEINQCIEYARKALISNNEYKDAKYNLAVGLFENKEYSKSLEICSELVKDDNYESKASELKIRIEQITCSWDNYAVTQQLLKSNSITVHPFLHISSISDESSNYKNARAWKKDEILSDVKKQYLKTDVKIRLGFLCGEIRNHPTFYLIKNLFKNLSRDIFSIYMFSYNHEVDKKLQIENDFNEFIDITHCDSIESINKVKDYNLDILVDLTTIISHNRSYIINKDIAKVVIAYLAYPGTTASDIYDYILTDQIVTPHEKQRFYSEQFLYLSKTYQINNGEINTDIINKRADFNLPDDGIILGCLNQSFKLDPIFFDIWINIMKNNNNTFLWLLDYGFEMKQNINTFVDERIDSNRIIYAERLNYESHLKRIQHIDIALDTRIYNGHTTSIEMIQAGIPLVTLKGTHFASRVSSSILNSLGLNDFITESCQEYERKIISLINQDKINSAKNLVKQKINNSEILNVKSFAESFEKALLKCFK